MTTRLLVCLTVLSTISGWRSKNINGEYWKSFDIFKTCKHGRKQSPVNIIKNDASIMQCAPMNFSYYDHPNDFDILNNGHTVILTLKKRNLTYSAYYGRTTTQSYEGSLTIPPCQEIVLWTVFKKRCPVSAGQMRTFRKVFNDGDTHMNIFRLPQPLNGRTVLYNRS
ncbi:CA4 [Lepeophtheirus salmonis]|uniref:carbonic anhydrase n=1 Tax=Lepeophtheirus salmonis TaxID=72036 RepID=A0A7R8D765_LEPSM|nr:CA4 [Lepeophtheirus salmonis]CAF3024530.1 CA4 [Lepeophtheirus salmonis]